MSDSFVFSNCNEPETKRSLRIAIALQKRCILDFSQLAVRVRKSNNVFVIFTIAVVCTNAFIYIVSFFYTFKTLFDNANSHMRYVGLVKHFFPYSS